MEEWEPIRENKKYRLKPNGYPVRHVTIYCGGDYPEVHVRYILATDGMLDNTESGCHPRNPRKRPMNAMLTNANRPKGTEKERTMKLIE